MLDPLPELRGLFREYALRRRLMATETALQIIEQPWQPLLIDVRQASRERLRLPHDTLRLLGEHRRRRMRVLVHGPPLRVGVNMEIVVWVAIAAKSVLPSLGDRDGYGNETEVAYVPLRKFVFGDDDPLVPRAGENAVLLERAGEVLEPPIELGRLPTVERLKLGRGHLKAGRVGSRAFSLLHTSARSWETLEAALEAVSCGDVLFLLVVEAAQGG